LLVSGRSGPIEFLSYVSDSSPFAPDLYVPSLSLRLAIPTRPINPLPSSPSSSSPSVPGSGTLGWPLKSPVAVPLKPPQLPLTHMFTLPKAIPVNTFSSVLDRNVQIPAASSK